MAIAAIEYTGAPEAFLSSSDTLNSPEKPERHLRVVPDIGAMSLTATEVLRELGFDNWGRPLDSSQSVTLYPEDTRRYDAAMRSLGAKP